MRRILVIYGAGAGFVPTTHHYLDAFRRHSRFQVEYLCIEHAPKEVVDLGCYDAIWVNYCARLIVESHYPDAVPEALKESLARYAGPKLVAVQDEYDHTNRLHHELLRIGANVVLTCVPQASIEYVYPRGVFPELRCETVLTGYVSDDLLRISGVR